jgi:hypothetical protein
MDIPKLSRVSVASDGTQGNGDSWGDPSISSDGRYVAFFSIASNLLDKDTNGHPHVFVWERTSTSSGGGGGGGGCLIGLTAAGLGW